MTDLKIKLSLETERFEIGVVEVETSSEENRKTLSNVLKIIHAMNEFKPSTMIFFSTISVATAFTMYFFKH